MTDIKFDQGAATALASSSRKAATVLKDEGTVRSGAVTTASDGFTGPYKNSFDRVCGTEETDRNNLKSALEELAKKVEETAVKAAEEKKRLKEMRAWEQRRDAGVPTGYLKEVSCYGPLIYQNPPNYCPADPRTGKQPSKIIVSVTTDPEPSRIPILPPSMEVSFSAQTRDRSASGAKGSDKVSAKPAKLDKFVTTRASSDKTIGDAITNLQSSWSNFTSKCSWANFADVNIFSGISTYQEENQADRTWVAGIAAAFEKAGSGTFKTTQEETTVAGIQSQLSGKDPRYKEEAIRTLKDPRLSNEEREDAAKRFASVPGNENFAADLAEELLGEAKKQRTEENINRAAAVINGISFSPKASAATIRKIKHSGLMEGLETAFIAAYEKDASNSGVYPNPALSIWNKQVAAKKLSSALSSLLSSGDQEIARQNPEESRQLARDIINTLKTASSLIAYDGIKTHPSADHPYIISRLLRDCKLSTPFLTTAGKLLEDIEKGFAKTKESWRLRTSKSVANTDLYNAIFANTKDADFDPLAAYMSALGKNGEASLRFFTGKGANHPDENLTTEEALERQKYWIMRRKWAHDKFTGLTAALDAAVTSKGNVGTPEAVRLASNLVELLANRERGLDRSLENPKENPVIFHDEKEKLTKDSLSSRAASSLAHILGTYMPSVDYALVNESPYSKSGLNRTYKEYDKRKDLTLDSEMPVFSEDDLNILHKAIFSDPEGLSTMKKMASSYQNARMVAVAKLYRGSPELDEVLEQALNSDATLEGHYMRIIHETNSENTETRNKQIEFWADRASDSAKAGVTLATLPAGPVSSVVTNYLSGIAIDDANQAFKDYAQTSENSILKNSRDQAENYREARFHGAIKNLYDAGLITREDIEKEAQRKGYTKEEVENFMVNGQYPTFDQMKHKGDIDLSQGVGGKHVDRKKYLDAFKSATDAYFQ